jgi:predicted DNA-binding mobile mystery protein A
MINTKKKLVIEQIDKKLLKYAIIEESDLPLKGWIYTIRKALNMSLAQFGRKLKITPPSVMEIEQREQNKSITLKKLIEAADALNLRFVYGFVPKGLSLEKMIEERALQVAHNIVMRTSQSMALEDQQNPDERVQKAIKDRAKNIKDEMPRFLWD